MMVVVLYRGEEGGGGGLVYVFEMFGLTKVVSTN